jgi:hypothetical protein
VLVVVGLSVAVAVAVALAARVLLTGGPELGDSFTGQHRLVTAEFAYHDRADAPIGADGPQNPAAGGVGVPQGVVASSSGMRIHSTG